MKNEIKITVSQLIEMLKSWNFGAQPASVQYVTDPDWKNVASGRMFPNVKKIANLNVFLGAIYENSVNNQLEREGKISDFVAKPLWNGKGKRINGVLAQHVEKDKYYLSIKPQRTLKSIFFDIASLVIMQKDVLQPYLKSYVVAPTNQGVEEGKEILHREISIENVRRLKFKKMTYVISPAI